MESEKYGDFVKNITKGIFLLILAVSGGFISEILGCRSQKLLSENMILKHLILLTILYFAFDFVKSESEIHPSYVFGYSIIAYVLFIMYTKMNIYFTIIVFILFLVIHVNQNLINYYSTGKNKNYERLKYYKQLRTFFVFSILILIITGFINYALFQYNDKKANWSTIDFIFGIPKCNSLITN